MQGKHRVRTQRPTHRWLRGFTALASVVLLISTAVGGGASYAINNLGKHIKTISTGDLKHVDKPKSVKVTDTSATNILIMGSDSRAGSGNTGYGKVAGARSDTTLLVHIYKGRKAATIISIPRDSYVQIPPCTDANGKSYGTWKTKFNAAFSMAGPICTIKTVEAATGVPINKFMVLDFNGFKQVVDAVGGVEVCLTTPVYDPVRKGIGGSGLNLPAGYSKISGNQALAFVRARESLGDGSDIGRIQRQQEFLSSMIRGILTSGMLKNPAMMYKVLDAITNSMTTSADLASVPALENFALSMSGVSPSKIKFITVPNKYIDHGNVGWLPEAKTMFDAIAADKPWPPVTAKPLVSASPSASASAHVKKSPSAIPSPSESGVISPGTYSCTAGNNRVKK